MLAIPSLKRYVLGFIFDSYKVGDKQERFVSVLLERKQRPAWQAGKLNGVGGKIELGESPFEAMHRECKEETTLDIRDWVEYGEIVGPDFSVRLFYTVSDLYRIPYESPDEPLLIMHLCDLYEHENMFVNHALPCIVGAVAHHNTRNFDMILRFKVPDEKTLDMFE